MYKDILHLIDLNNNILFYNRNEYNSASLILQLMLSNDCISNITIIDTADEINFVKRNFKVDSTIQLFGYTNEDDIIQYINKTKRNQENYIVVQHKTRHVSKLFNPQLFNYTINVSNKDKYVIRNLMVRQKVLNT